MIGDRLSKRMHMVASMVDESSVADIGCDHAFVSMYLISSGTAKKVVAMDVNKGPIGIAKENVKMSGLQDKIDIRLSNGLEKLKEDEVECAVIAGMGGPLMVDILTRGRKHTLAGIHLVLQPQSDIYKVREYLYQIGYEIIKEDMLVEEGKFYTAFKAVPEREQITPYSEEELHFGRYLLIHRHPVLREYLQKEINISKSLLDKLQEATSDKSRERRTDVIERIALLEKCLEHYQ